MRIERVDERTVKCFLSNEELEEYDISYRDFLMRSDKAREVVEDIIEQAEEEVGYQPPRFAFDLQIMLMPDKGMILTFSERDPEADSPEKEFMDCLGRMKSLLTDGKKHNSFENMQRWIDWMNELKQIGERAKASGQTGGTGQDYIDTSREAVKETEENRTAKEESDRPEFAVFSFPQLRQVCSYAGVLPEDLGIKSTLYCMEGWYYLFLEKGRDTYERYSRACIQAMEFAAGFTADRSAADMLKEHGECLIAEQAVGKLRI